jgi:hypothetical protein
MGGATPTISVFANPSLHFHVMDSIRVNWRNSRKRFPAVRRTCGHFGLRWQSEARHRFRRSGTVLNVPPRWFAQKRRRRCALPAQNKTGFACLQTCAVDQIG